MARANATGDNKLPLTMIGKAENPRALKNVSRGALPVKSKECLDDINPIPRVVSSRVHSRSQEIPSNQEPSNQGTSSP